MTRSLGHLRAAPAALFTALLFAAPLAAHDLHESAPATRSELLPTFADAVRVASPSVVSIYATRVIESRRSIFDDNPFFREFFRNFGGGRRLANSLGSGVVVGEDGIVITAEHVIKGANEVRVALADRREYEAEILLADARADIAVLRLPEAKSLPVLRVRGAEEMEVGDLVLAIGNPLGVGQTVTSGILSAVARTGNDGRYFLQTDAAINVGNSGGALVDASGALVGINTAIVTRSGGSDGIGFAVPSNLAMLAVEAARRGEDEIPRPWPGLEVQEVTALMAEAIGMESPVGVAIVRIDRRSSFTRAGLKVGDLLLAVDGKPVHAPHELDYHLALAGPDTQVDFEVYGRDSTVSVTLESAPENPPGNQQTFGHWAGAFAGVSVANANPALAERYGVDSVGVSGVLVTGVSGSARRWLRQGDFVRKINGFIMTDVESLRDAVRQNARGGRSWLVLLGRGEQVVRIRLGG